MEGIPKQNASNQTLFDESCDLGSTPDNRYLKTCEASSNPKFGMLEQMLTTFQNYFKHFIRVKVFYQNI